MLYVWGPSPEDFESECFPQTLDGFDTGFIMRSSQNASRDSGFPMHLD